MYLPAEDSYLLSEVLKKIKIKPKEKILEIGCGSGIQLQTLKNLGAKDILGTDINPNAVAHCKKLWFNCIHSDLFEKIEGKFSLILFNPPYLPENKFDKMPDTTGGKNGSEIINKFLTQAKKYLAPEGKILLLTSSLTKKINWQNYKKKLITKRKIFFEELFVWELSV